MAAHSCAAINPTIIIAGLIKRTGPSKSVNGRASLARRSYNMIDRHQFAPRWVKALKDASIPMCMINGVEEPISGSHACDAIERELPHIAVTPMSGVGHFPLIEAPDQCVEHLLHFHYQFGTIG